MLSHPVLMSSGETMAPWVLTVEGDLPELQRVDYGRQIVLSFVVVRVSCPMTWEGLVALWVC